MQGRACALSVPLPVRYKLLAVESSLSGRCLTFIESNPQPAMTTTGDGEDMPTPPPLTQADIPAAVRAVAEALNDQLKEARPPAPPTDAGHRDPADPGVGTAPRPCKSLLFRLALFRAAKLGQV